MCGIRRPSRLASWKWGAGESCFVLWRELKSSCCTNCYGRGAQLQASVNFSCCNEANILNMILAKHIMESSRMTLPGSWISAKYFIFSFNAKQVHITVHPIACFHLIIMEITSQWRGILWRASKCHGQVAGFLLHISFFISSKTSSHNAHPISFICYLK